MHTRWTRKPKRERESPANHVCYVNVSHVYTSVLWLGCVSCYASTARPVFKSSIWKNGPSPWEISIITNISIITITIITIIIRIIIIRSFKGYVEVRMCTWPQRSWPMILARGTQIRKIKTTTNTNYLWTTKIIVEKEKKNKKIAKSTNKKKIK